MDKYTGAAEWKPTGGQGGASELEAAMGSLNVGASEWNPAALASQAQEWVPPGAASANSSYGNTVATGGSYGGYGGYGGYGAAPGYPRQPQQQLHHQTPFPPVAAQYYAAPPAAWPAQQQVDAEELDEHSVIQEELNKQFLREQSESHASTV